jgi:hypothetical protein
VEDEINKMKGEINAEFDAFCGELENVLPGERGRGIPRNSAKVRRPRMEAAPDTKLPPGNT